MATSTSSLTLNCHLCSVPFNITENEKPFSCKQEHIFTCQYCTKLLIKPVCLECGQETGFNRRIFDEIFATLREYYQSNSYTSCLEADTSKQLLQRDINMRMKPFSQLIRSAKQFPLDRDRMYNACLMTALEDSEKMRKNFDQLCEFLKNEPFDLATAKQKYAEICGKDCDGFILNCEYLQAIHEAARKQTLLPNLFLLTENMSETKDGNFDGSCKIFMQRFELGIKSAIKMREKQPKSIRVGLIGNAKQGKSSLCNYLRGVYKRPTTNDPNQYNYAAIGASQVTSLCTVCYIYDFRDEKSGESYSIEFLDLAGKIDLFDKTNSHYKQVIRKADCDVYLIVRKATPYSLDEIVWKKFIEDECHRKCLLVQTDTDVTFPAKFAEYYDDHEFDPEDLNAKEEFDEVINDMRSHTLDCLRTEERSHVKMKDIYFVGCPPSASGDMNDAARFHVQFDLGKLRSRIFEIADQENWPRLKRDIIKAASFFISIHYKRNHKISVLRETLLSSVSSVIPFLDVWFTRSSKKKIYEEFGLNEDFINYLNDFASKYSTTIQTAKPDNNNYTSMDVAANTIKAAATAGGLAVKLSSTAAAGAVVGGVAFAPILIPMALLTAIAQAGGTAFSTKRQLEECIVTACEYIEMAMKFIADLLFQPKIIACPDATTTA